MNIKDYISSGILESYVLGELRGNEKKEVEKNADEYPEVYKEIREITEAFHCISVQCMKQAGIHPNFPYSSKHNANLGNDQRNHLKTEKKLRKKIQIANVMASAAILLAGVSIFVAANLYIDLKNTQEQPLSSSVIDQQNFNGYSEIRYEADLNDESDGFLFFKDFKKIDLTDLSNNIDAHCAIFWNEKTNDLFLQVYYLPYQESGNQYQLWAIIDDIPVDMGLIPNDMNEDFFKMKSTKYASAFFITSEPAGGSKFPDFNSKIVFSDLTEH